MNEMLLPGEKVLATRPANLMFGFEQTEEVIKQNPAVDATSAIAQVVALIPSMVKLRSIGGKLHVTTYRLYFASHRLNTTRGSCSIFWPTITYDEPIAGVFAGQLVVKTHVVTYRFAVRDAKELSQLLRSTKEKPVDVAALRTHALAAVDKVSAGISPFWVGPLKTPEQIKALESTLQEKKANSIQVVGLMGLLELFVDKP